tara:strand:- start:2030 stop:2524 length:495 start_codon:yes stop_codon:yes gene_type:complete
MFQETQINDLVDLLTTLNNNTKIYFGCDSVRKVINNVYHARYATCVIVHKNGNNGCRIFSHESIEPDYDVRMNRPSMRLMNETMKVCEAYTQLMPWIDGYDVEIHLDINTDPMEGSSCVAQQAAGYVLGVTGIEPKMKPDSFAASYGADGIAHGRYQHRVNTHV